MKNSKKKSRTDWEFLADESDEGIDFSDIPELGPDFWQNATSRLPDKKTSITLRLDPDVIAWFRMSGRGYQTRINAVLRSYMQASRKSA
ncbi:MAG: BrnA antitoxin family protein [Candidatus Hydrogenedentes bacterium]|nr:BrnA antitoxin family protein [Candidatus Hydrogenedentota bacterium]